MSPGFSEAELAFGPWRLLRARRVLLRNGVPVLLGSRAFDLLLALIEAGGEVVTKDALLRRIWPGSVVEENNLQVQVSALRKALGADAAQLVVTIPGRGYRFGGLLHGPAAPPEPAAARPPGTERPGLAVMPFRNLSGEAEQDYFADGITEDLTTALSQLRWFSVTARNTALTYKGRAVDVREIGRELGVGYVLEGSVRKAGGRLRIAVQLSDARTGCQLWGEHVDAEAEDIFALQDRVAEAVAGAVEPSLRCAEAERSRARPAESLGAYELYLRALPHRFSTREGGEELVRLLRRAVALEPGFTAAKGLLAGQLVMRFAQGWATEGDVEEALRHAREVVAEGGAEDPTALAWAGHALTYLGRDYEGGLAASDRALRLAPGSAQVLVLGAWNRLYVDDWRTAVERIERAMRLSPVDPAMFHFTATLGAAHFVGEGYEEAVGWLRRALHDRPGFLIALRFLAACLAQLGRQEAAREAVRALLDAAPGYTLAAAAAQSAFHGRVRERYLDGLRRAGLPVG